jgi:hypothetical protein
MSLKDKSNEEILSLVGGLKNPTTLEVELSRRFIELTEEAIVQEEEDDFYIELELEETEEIQMMPIAVAQAICAIGMLVTGASILLVIC